MNSCQSFEMARKMISNKGTKVAYNCHLHNYERFWTEAQSEDTSFGLISVHPITAAKALLFLEHEASWLKVIAFTHLAYMSVVMCWPGLSLKLWLRVGLHWLGLIRTSSPVQAIRQGSAQAGLGLSPSFSVVVHMYLLINAALMWA